MLYRRHPLQLGISGKHSRHRRPLHFQSALRFLPSVSYAVLLTDMERVGLTLETATAAGAQPRTFIQHSLQVLCPGSGTINIIPDRLDIGRNGRSGWVILNLQPAVSQCR